MKIAVIQITYNDDYKFKEWCGWYEEYKNEIDVHIVVDNGSKPEYLAQVKSYFKDSVIIERTFNGGCTAAYNDGIRYALQDPEIDAISLLANDIKVAPGFFKTLYDFLYSKDEYGMVGPVFLFKDSETKVSTFGDAINRFGIPHLTYRRMEWGELPESQEIAYMGGGCNLSKRAFYEKVGLQDENLFMYNDEMDMYFRAIKCGFKEASIKYAKAWHYHISNNQSDDKDMPYKMAFINGRNRVYIIKKHFSVIKGALFFIYMLATETIVLLRDFKNKETRKKYSSKFKGFFAGAKGNMDNSFMY